MAYTPTNWVNDQAPALSAANLNKLTDELESQAAAQSISHTLPTWVNNSTPALTDATALNEIERVIDVVAASLSLSYTPTTWQSGWTPARNAANFNKMEVQAQGNRAAMDAPGTYTYRFATFNPATDKITGAVNRYNDPANTWWWVPGWADPPAGAALWSDGGVSSTGPGGIWPFSSLYGPGFKFVVVPDPEMPYPLPPFQNPPGSGPDTRECSFLVDPTDTNVFPSGIPWVEATHSFEWTWRRTSAENPSGWPTGVDMFEGFLNGFIIGGLGSVGHHLYFTNLSGTMHYYVGRETAFNVWDRTHCSIPFNADEYHHIKFEYKLSTTNGWMRAYTGINGGAYQQWMDYSGPTIPPGSTSMYAHGRWTQRYPLGGPKCVLEVINPRVTIT